MKAIGTFFFVSTLKKCNVFVLKHSCCILLFFTVTITSIGEQSKYLRDLNPFLIHWESKLT